MSKVHSWTEGLILVSWKVLTSPWNIHIYQILSEAMFCNHHRYYITVKSRCVRTSEVSSHRNVSSIPGKAYSICHSLSETNLEKNGIFFSELFKYQQWVNSLRPRQNGRYNADDIFKCIFLNENVWFPTKLSLKFVPTGPINNIPALVLIMAWRRPGDKPLSEPMMVSLLTHICVTRPQWVNANGDETPQRNQSCLSFN